MSDYAHDEILQARAMLACPHYRGEGICRSGCVTEPACQTCEPTEGWAAIAAHSEPEVIRVDGGCPCPHCGEPYRSHPWDDNQTFLGEPYLRIGCDGRRLKL